MQEEELIKRCQRFERRAQELMYQRYAPVMMGVCRRYLRDNMEAEDILSEGFFKAFTRMGQYRFDGSFEGWLRRIMVNEALMHLRRKHDFNISLESSYIQPAATGTPYTELAEKSILNLLETLPTGYRTIFNMYVIEGYKHREIAKKLGISIHTSKSQLIKARARLRAMLEDEKTQTG